MMTRPAMVLAVFGGLITASPAYAHSEGLQGGFVAGLLHPLTGRDHLLAMVAVGIWGAILGRPLLYVLPVVFPVIMAMAGVAAIAGMPLPPVEFGIVVSVIVLGLAIALNWAPPAWAAIAIVAFFALFHGHAHGSELPSMADPIAYSAGFVSATGGLHLAGIGIGAVDARSGGRTALRVIGAGIALAGLWFTWAIIN